MAIHNGSYRQEQQNLSSDLEDDLRKACSECQAETRTGDVPSTVKLGQKLGRNDWDIKLGTERLAFARSQKTKQAAGMAACFFLAGSSSDTS